MNLKKINKFFIIILLFFSITNIFNFKIFATNQNLDSKVNNFNHLYYNCNNNNKFAYSYSQIYFDNIKQMNKFTIRILKNSNEILNKLDEKNLLIEFYDDTNPILLLPIELENYENKLYYCFNINLENYIFDFNKIYYINIKTRNNKYLLKGTYVLQQEEFLSSNFDEENLIYDQFYLGKLNLSKIDNNFNFKTPINDINDNTSNTKNILKYFINCDPEEFEFEKIKGIYFNGKKKQFIPNNLTIYLIKNSNEILKYLNNDDILKIEFYDNENMENKLFEISAVLNIYNQNLTYNFTICLKSKQQKNKTLIELNKPYFIKIKYYDNQNTSNDLLIGKFELNIDYSILETNKTKQTKFGEAIIKKIIYKPYLDLNLFLPDNDSDTDY